MIWAEVSKVIRNGQHVGHPATVQDVLLVRGRLLGLAAVSHVNEKAHWCIGSKCKLNLPEPAVRMPRIEASAQRVAAFKNPSFTCSLPYSSHARSSLTAAITDAQSDLLLLATMAVSNARLHLRAVADSRSSIIASSSRRASCTSGSDE
jgi:hypothetical protein